MKTTLHSEPSLRDAGLDPESNVGMARLSNVSRIFGSGVVLLYQFKEWWFAFGGVNGDAAVVRRLMGWPQNPRETVEPIPLAHQGELLYRLHRDAIPFVVIDAAAVR